MSLDRSTVKKMASLARLRVEDEELDTLVDELSNIFGRLAILMV